MFRLVREEWSRCVSSHSKRVGVTNNMHNLPEMSCTVTRMRNLFRKTSVHTHAWCPCHNFRVPCQTLLLQAVSLSNDKIRHIHGNNTFLSCPSVCKMHVVTIQIRDACVPFCVFVFLRPSPLLICNASGRWALFCLCCCRP